jgi:hypothetical protein
MNNSMLLFYAKTLTARVEYIARLMLGDLLGINLQFTADLSEYHAYPGPKIAYDPGPVEEGIAIEPSGLLFEQTIRMQNPRPKRDNGLPVLFPSDNPGSALQFDPFAASFYMVSRYEEYLPFKPDRYGRFPASESIAVKEHFLDLPVVHLWTELLATTILKEYPSCSIHPPAYRFVPTIDIDHAYAYKERTASRIFGGLARATMHFRFSEVAHRLKVLSGLSTDPYDNYDFILETHAGSGIQPLWFILFADYGGHDNNVTVTSPGFYELIRHLDRNGTVGIHPSLSSAKHRRRLGMELDGLSRVVRRQVNHSRQHFLKFRLPDTFNRLVTLGITDDYSMGYASHPGFRAGMAKPFRFYDLAANHVTPLLLHPVTVMDVTLLDYQRLTPVKSLEVLENLIRTTAMVNGDFVSLWHNESLSDTGRWRGWRDVYREMTSMATRI